MAQPAILLVGAGELGSRHLQSLVSLTGAEIDVLEPSAFSAKRATARIGQVENNAALVAFFTSVDELKPSYNVIIVATNAAIRFDVTLAVLNVCTTSYLIFEKVLFQRLADFPAMQSVLAQQGIKAYVNCPRRLYSLYKNMQALLTSGPLSVTVAGADWGLACNSIHFIDMVAMLSGEELQHVDAGETGKPIASKREGYQELMGTLACEFDKGSSITLQCESDAQKYNTYAVTLCQGDNTWVIDEASGQVYVGSKQGACIVDGPRPPYQSELTASVVNQLLATGECELPTFNQSVALHEPMISALLPRFELMHTPDAACPIT